MSTCGEPCDGCSNRAEHHLCDSCCHDEVNALQKENRELRERLEWQAACTKALMESQERLVAELKEARAECARQMEYGVKQHEAAQAALRERDDAQAWAKERSDFAAAETEHANRWSVRAHKAEAEVKRLRGLTPEFPPRPPDGEGLPRYGLRWNGPTKPLAVPLADGYWTPWHLADAAYQRGAEAMREAVTQKISVMEDRWSNIILACEAKGAEASDKIMVEHDCLRDVLDLISQTTIPKDKP